MGGHLQPDLISVEIVDDQGCVLPPGEAGEVVATPLQVTGMPLVRFKTGDIAVLHAEPCPCGRNSDRLGPVIGRKSQMLKYRGTTVYPPAIFSVLRKLPEICGFYLEVHSDFDLSDRIRLVVGSADSSLSTSTISETIAAAIRVKPEVVIDTPDAVERKTTLDGKRKPVLFFDYRRTPGQAMP
jgi:phenylacetate-CoA ligase